MTDKTRLDGMDLWFLAKEFNELAHSKVQKIFQIDNTFIFQFFVSGKGKRLLKITPGFLFLIDEFNAPGLIKPFCRILRNYLANTLLLEINQIKTERTLQFSFATKTGNINLFIELFDKGNLIICDASNRIIHPLHSQVRKDGLITRGEIYLLPVKKSIFEAKPEDFKNQTKPLSLILAVDFGLGKDYAEELCLRAGLELNQHNLAVIEINRLLSEINKLKLQKLEPVIVDGRAAPFVFKKDIAKDFTPAKSFSKALENTVVFVQKQSPLEKKRIKITKIIELQKQQIENLQRQSDENSAKGEAIYYNYMLAKEILETVNSLKKMISWPEIRERLKNNGHIKEIRENTQEIILEL